MPDAAAVTRLRPRALRELGLVVLLYVGYSLARLVADSDVTRGTANARDLLGVERALHLDVESWANDLLMRAPDLALVASYWYSLLHYVVTPAVLVWAYRRHAPRYRVVRNALVTATALGLLGFVLVPMAPPRMLPGYIDTLAATSSQGWWGGDASAPKGLGGLTNELAAMPSLHVGWALWCGWVVFVCTRSTWARIAGVGYVAGTTLVVVATANHYLLDAVGGAVVVTAGVVVATRLASLGRPRGALPATAAAPARLAVPAAREAEPVEQAA